jgi:hypothetical protein
MKRSTLVAIVALPAVLIAAAYAAQGNADTRPVGGPGKP